MNCRPARSAEPYCGHDPNATCQWPVRSAVGVSEAMSSLRVATGRRTVGGSAGDMTSVPESDPRAFRTPTLTTGAQPDERLHHLRPDLQAITPCLPCQPINSDPGILPRRMHTDVGEATLGGRGRDAVHPRAIVAGHVPDVIAAPPSVSQPTLHQSLPSRYVQPPAPLHPANLRSAGLLTTPRPRMEARIGHRGSGDGPVRQVRESPLVMLA